MKNVFLSISLVASIGLGISMAQAENANNGSHLMSDAEMEMTVKNRIAQKYQEGNIGSTHKSIMSGDLRARASESTSSEKRMVYEISGNTLVGSLKPSNEEIVANMFNNLLPHDNE